MGKHTLIKKSSSDKRTHADLKRLQQLPLEQKINLSLRRIEQFYKRFNGQVYISFSGGKDSTVLADLVWSLFPDIVAVFSNTGLEYPEIVTFVRKKSKTHNVIEVKPKKTFNKVINDSGWAVVSKVQSMALNRCASAINRLRDAVTIKEHNEAYRALDYRLNGRINKKTGKKENAGVVSKKHQYLINAPFKISERCCDVLKKNPFKNYNNSSGKKPFIGTMAEESKLRTDDYIEHGCNMFNKKEPQSAPMSFWTEQDVLEYIVKYKVDYCDKIYGDIVATKPHLQMDIFGAPDEKQEYKTTGEKRTGCMFCMFGLELETKANNGENRFTRMAKSKNKKHRDIHHNLMHGLGGKHVCEFMNLPWK